MSEIPVANLLAGLARLPIRDWLAVRDAAEGEEVARDLYAAYRAAVAAAIQQGRTRDVRAVEDDARRLTGAIAWFAESRPDGEAITRRDVAALEILAEWPPWGS